jgi:hypothetical protein
MKERGIRLSNMWLTYPLDGNTPGKLGLMSDRRRGLEWFFTQKVLRSCFSTSPEDGAATDQAVGEATAHQTYNRYGPRER